MAIRHSQKEGVRDEEVPKGFFQPSTTPHGSTPMAQTSLIRRLDGQLFAYSWTTGVKAVEPPKRPMTDDDKIAWLMRLERQGLKEEVELQLERWCR